MEKPVRVFGQMQTATHICDDVCEKIMIIEYNGDLDLRPCDNIVITIEITIVITILIIVEPFLSSLTLVYETSTT